MLTFAGLILGALAQAFLDALAGKVTDAVWSKLQGEPARNALKQALGAAIQRYERYARQHWYLELVSPLLQQDGLLAQPDVEEELTQIIRFEREPDYRLIGRRWKAYIDSPPPWCNFSDEVRRFVEFFREELRRTEAFRPVFAGKQLELIATSSAASAESLTAIEGELADISSLLSSGFANVAQYFSRAFPSVRDEIRDFTWYIEERTRDFVGRDFIFKQIRDFTEQQPRGYFLVRGDPGAGKTALAAQLVKTQGLVHHFNIRSIGIKWTDLFLRNMCAQLIARYKLEDPVPSEKDLRDGGILATLLDKVAQRVQGKEKVVIVIDALDEVDDANLSSGTNVLCLPETLPENIFIIATVRNNAPVPLQMKYHPLYIAPNSPENQEDIRRYIQEKLARPGIKKYIVAQGITDEAFVAHLENKSEGNFMYLSYMLPDIEDGVYNDLEFTFLPTGLEGYYEAHWQRMRGPGDEAWFNYKLPVLMALAAAEAPVTIGMIQAFSGVRDSARVAALLAKGQWGQFLHKDEAPDIAQRRYSLYHASFREFLLRKEELKEAGVNFIDAKRRINTFYRSKLRRQENR